MLYAARSRDISTQAPVRRKIKDCGKASGLDFAVIDRKFLEQWHAAREFPMN